jgi:hypothetical protein
MAYSKIERSRRRFTIRYLALRVPLALILEAISCALVIGVALSRRPHWRGTQTGLLWVLAMVAGLWCHSIHCQLIYAWIRRDPTDPGQGGKLVIAAYVLVWVAGGIYAWMMPR